jgi:hypothetical protein
MSACRIIFFLALYPFNDAIMRDVGKCNRGWTQSYQIWKLENETQALFLVR